MDQVTAKADPNRNYAKAPEGQHQAVLVDVIDLGMHDNVYQGQSKGLVHKCALVFQIDEINPDTSKPFEIAKDFTVSMGEKANLRKFLGTWRGKSYSDAEAEEGAPLHKLYGINALMQVEHKQSKSNPDRTYANIVSVTKLPKNMEAIKPFEYARAEYWNERIGKKQEEPPPHDDDDASSEDDDLPF